MEYKATISEERAMLNDGLGKEAFEMAVIELLGQDALLGWELPIYETAQMFWNAGLQTAAAVCDARANLCGDKADKTDDHEDAIELKARAWQICVLAAEIRGLVVPNALHEPHAGNETTEAKK